MALQLVTQPDPEHFALSGVRKIGWQRSHACTPRAAFSRTLDLFTNLFR